MAEVARFGGRSSDRTDGPTGPASPGPACPPGTAEPSVRRTVVVCLGNVTEVLGMVPYVTDLVRDHDVHIVFSSDNHETLFRTHFPEPAPFQVLRPEADARGLWPAWQRWVNRAPRGAHKRLLARGLRGLRGRLVRNEYNWVEVWAETTLAALDPLAIITGSDRDLRPRSAVFKTARRMGISVIVVPIAFPAMRESLIERRSHRGFRFAAGDPIVMALPEHFIPLPDGARLGFFAAPIYRRFKYTGLLRGNPWALGGVWADKVLVASPQVANQLSAAGLPESVLEVSGSAELDSLAGQLAERRPRAEVLAGLGIDPASEPVVIGWAVHQYTEHKMCAEAQSLEIMRQVARVLDRPGVVVLASLHPKMDRKRYAWLEQEFANLHLLEDRLVTVLGACDLTLSAGFSSTAAWSPAIGTPSLIYDFLLLRERIFEGAVGVRVVETPDALAAQVDALCRNDAGWQAWVTATRQDRDRLGPIDGGSLARIRQAILTARAAKARVPA